MQELLLATPTELAVCHALADFRFLTADQMMRLGVTKAKRHLYATLQKHNTHKRPLIGKLDFGVLPTKGRLPIIYYLTQRGANLLLEEGRNEWTLNFPKRVTLFHKDYFHRRASVDFQISTVLWIKANNARLRLFDTYYDRTDGKKGLQPKTTINFKNGQFTPDAIFNIVTPDETERLCAFELHMGRHVSRLEKQIDVYLKAIQVSAIETSYNYPQAVRVLVVFEQERLIETFQKHMMKRNLPDSLATRFFLKSLDEVKADFFNNWHKFDPAKPPAPLF